MAVMIEYLMKPESHGHVLCSSFPFARWYKTLVPQFTEECVSIVPGQEDLRSESEEVETAEKHPVSEIDNSTALNSFC